MRKRILIADDHALIISGVYALLAADFDVVGGLSNGRLLVAEAKRLIPDVVVLDVGMPELNGIEAARLVSAALPGVAIVFLTQQLDGHYVESAFSAGAKAYVAKQSASTELVMAIRLALKGNYYVTPLAVSKRWKLSSNRDPSENPAGLFRGRLTARQREVLRLVADGKATKEIANSLDISVATVNFHKAAIMDELGIRTTAELTRYAITNGLMDF